MTSGSRRSNRKKYRRDTNDHVIFVLVILVAAAAYVHPAKSLIKEHSVLEIIRIALLLLGLVILARIFRKLTKRNTTRHLSYSPVDSMSGIEFERYVADLLRHQGYSQVQLTERYDLGIDIIAKKEGLVWGIQVKRYNTPVKLAAVRQAVAALQYYSCDRAMVITNSSFSAAAKDLAASNSCVLVDGQRLMRWAK
jgi:HJR/Mrr/RecB family endonuclease